MQTTVVNASELGDDWTPKAHMPRVLAAIKHVREGDVIRVRDHRMPDKGEGQRRWHLVTVRDTQVDRATVLVGTNKWPIAYVATADELVELVDIKRTVTMRCVVCTPTNATAEERTRLTVTLEDFIDVDLMKRGGQHVHILTTLETVEQTGYCKEHGTAFLS